MAEYSINKSVTLTTANTILSPDKYSAPTKRKLFSIVNTGAVNASIAIDAEAVAGEGIVLLPGGSYSESTDAASQCTQKRISAISTGAGTTIAFHERIEGDA